MAWQGRVVDLQTRAMGLLRRKEGPLTERLARVAGPHGLGQVPARLAPDALVTTVCGFCSTGCGLTAHLRGGVAVNLSPDPTYPVNLGTACPKGWEALSPLDAEDRAKHPLLRNAEGELVPVSWSDALAELARRIRAIGAEHGPSACAFLSTGQIPTEEMLILGAVAKFGLGMVHGDGNTRQCMATSVTAYKEAFGFDAPPYTYKDFEESDVIVLVGSNLCIAHPVMWGRICRNPHSPRIVVVDPRKTETAMAASDHFAIRPKSDLAFFYGLARILIERSWIDRAFIDAHTRGFEEFSAFVQEFTLERVEHDTGISAAELERLARLIHDGKRVSFWWTMGVNQSHEGVRLAQALIDLSLMTGNIGRPGTGANSITGQCNAMGSRIFSNTTNLFAGRSFTDPDHRHEVARVLGIDVARIPAAPSLAYDQILERIDRGEIRGLWIIATNTAHSWIDREAAIRTLRKLDFLVVQDMYASTQTAQLAHLVLPAAGWGEKEGTFINSERRIGRTRKLRNPPGEARSDFEIVRAVAEAFGCQDLVERWKTPEDVFQSLKELSRGRPCDVTGIEGYAMLDREGGIQWPLREGSTLEQRERRLFEDGVFFHDDGRARFVYESTKAPPEPVDAVYPFVLLTGRGSSSQWHTDTRTGKSAVLRTLAVAGGYVEIHPDDALRRGIGQGSLVLVRSRRGSVQLRAKVQATVKPGQLFVPMHDARTNNLTYPCVDPYSRQPSYKHCAVSIKPLRD
jgi:assimilatory nitrate reductase catalytic subunit